MGGRRGGDESWVKKDGRKGRDGKEGVEERKDRKGRGMEIYRFQTKNQTLPMRIRVCKPDCRGYTERVTTHDHDFLVTIAGFVACV
jgi:hypothetical protein